MAFEIHVVENAPMTDIDDVDTVALRFMEDLGYIMRQYDPKTPVDSVRKSVPYKLFLDCFLRHQDKDWRVEDLSEELRTSVPTIYRHLAKLKALELIDEDAEDEGKVVHLKHYSFQLAWRVTEANVLSALDRYRAIVEFIQGHMRKVDKDKEAPVVSAPKRFRIRVRSSRARTTGGIDDVLPTFLEDIDYLSDQGPIEEDPRKGIAYRLVKECLLDRPNKFWDVDEVRTKLRTTRPTVYRHLNKLEAMGLTERKQVGKTVPPKKAHRIRYGSLRRAWSFTEEYAKVAMDNYKQTVLHLDELVQRGRKKGR